MNEYTFTEEKLKIKKLGKYEIVEQIGQGQEANVYKVKYQKNLYALKASNMMHSFNRDLLNKVKTNENLCRFIECFEDNKIKCEVYEYCNDGNLTKRLKEQIFDQNSILNFIRQICNGYQELFKNNIIHRDLKPDNIVYHNGIAKIADYGFARFVENPNEKGHFTQKCTPLFASPQIFQALFSSKCDVWSVGLIVYKMIYRVYPNEGVESIQQLNNFYNRAKENKIDYPKCDMPHLVELVRQMLKYSEEDRISWPQLFTHPMLQQSLDVIYLPYFQDLKEAEISEFFYYKAKQVNFFRDLLQNLLKDLEQQFMILNIWFSHTLFILGYLNGQSLPITFNNENFRSFQKSEKAKNLSSILVNQKTEIDSQISFFKVVRKSQSQMSFLNLKQQGQKFENLDIKQQIQKLEINSIQKQQLQGFFQPI